MGDPYYWYWATYRTTHGSPAPSLGEVLIIVLIPVLAVALCVGVATWERTQRRRRERGLTRRERRALAAIEGALRAEDPDLARRLTDFAAGAPVAPPSPRPTETQT